MTLQYSIGIGFDGGNVVKATCRLWNGKITKYGTATATLSIPQSITVTANLAWGVGSTTIDVTAAIGNTSYTKALSLNGTVNATAIAENAQSYPYDKAVAMKDACLYTSGSNSVTVPTAFMRSGSYIYSYSTQTISFNADAEITEGSVTAQVKTGGGTVVNTKAFTAKCTAGTPMASGGKAAAWVGGIKVGEVDISDWWTDAVASVTVTDLKVSQPLSKTDKYAHLIAIASNGEQKTWDCYCGLIYDGGYDAGWNACLAACTAVTDARKPGSSTTESKSCSEGHSVSFTYTAQGDSYGTLYTIPSARS